MQLQTPMKTIENLQRCIKDSNHIVAILGIEMLVESGGRNFDSNEESYRMEEEYGACPEELLSGSFYCAKKERFYKFYKKEMLGMKIGATAGYEALYKLQQQGKLHTVINLNYHPIPEPYHFARVIELNGNIQHYHCTKCHKTYDASYILQSQGIPQCSVCNGSIRPDIRLIGERINNSMLTLALEACDQADVVMILGQNIFGDRLQSNSSDIERRHQTKILFSQEKYLPEERADFIIHDEIQQIMPLLIQ